MNKLFALIASLTVGCLAPTNNEPPIPAADAGSPTPGESIGDCESAATRYAMPLCESQCAGTTDDGGTNAHWACVNRCLGLATQACVIALAPDGGATP
jgi:hypothetical protein